MFDYRHEYNECKEQLTRLKLERDEHRIYVDNAKNRIKTLNLEIQELKRNQLPLEKQIYEFQEIVIWLKKQNEDLQVRYNKLKSTKRIAIYDLTSIKKSHLNELYMLLGVNQQIG